METNEMSPKIIICSKCYAEIVPGISAYSGIPTPREPFTQAYNTWRHVNPKRDASHDAEPIKEGK